MIIKRSTFFCAVVALSGALTACDPIGDCQDAGGRWVEEIGECECTYEDRGNYNIHITDEEYEACRKEVPNEEASGEELD